MSLIPDSKGDPTETEIDPTILRVCWKIYSEALPVLYGNNTFCLCRVDTLRWFRHGRLPLVHPSNQIEHIMPVFYAQPNPQGRLSLIRNLTLILATQDQEYYVRPPRSVFHSGSKRTRTDWGALLELNPYTDGSRFVEFPALEVLELDFFDWLLTANEGINVSIVRTNAPTPHTLLLTSSCSVI